MSSHFGHLRTRRPPASSPFFFFLAVKKPNLNYDPSLKILREQISRGFSNFLFLRVTFEVLITAAVEEPVYREYRSLY
jgi:hypothetical protein